MKSILDNTNLCRLPCSKPDTSISWLEPTFACNLSCEGYYRYFLNKFGYLDFPVKPGMTIGPCTSLCRVDML